jgi:hypothetical protein
VAAPSSAPAPLVSAAGHRPSKATPAPLNPAPKRATIAPLPSNVAATSSAPAPTVSAAGQRPSKATPALLNPAPKRATTALYPPVAAPLSAPVPQVRPAARRLPSVTDGRTSALKTVVPPTAVLALLALALAPFAPLHKRERAPPVSAVRCCRSVISTRGLVLPTRVPLKAIPALVSLAGPDPPTIWEVAYALVMNNLNRSARRL